MSETNNKSAQPAVGGNVPATILRRVFATAIDVVIWMAFAFAGYVIVIVLYYSPLKTIGGVIGLIIISLMMPTYFLTETFRRGSLGKRLVGIQIVGRTTGRDERLRWIRWLIKSSPWLSSLPLTWVLELARVGPLVERVGQRVEAIAIFPFARFGRLMDWNAELLACPALFAVRFLQAGLVPMLFLLAGEFLVFGRSPRTLLDRWSGTEVVRADQRFPGFEVVPTSQAQAGEAAGQRANPLAGGSSVVSE